MSAIYGIFRFDGDVVDARALHRMGIALKHRATHDRATEVLGAVGLGVCVSHVTLEDRFDAQPVCDETAQVTLVADCRLDNRAVLAGVLGISTKELADLPDSTLILHAYLKWGEGCAAHLLGDFTFALWDGRSHRLFLARDHMGQRDLSYHLGDGFLAFAPEAKALWTLPDVPRELTDDMIARRLMHDMGSPVGDRGATGIKSLPGGTTLSIGPDGSPVISSYWEPIADPEHEGRDESYYIAAYRSVLGEAVACRVRRLINPPGLQLSGGYDSGAIAGLAGETLRRSGQKLVCASSTMSEDYEGTIRHAGTWVAMCARDMPWIDLRRVTRDGLDALSGLDQTMNERQTSVSSYGYVDDALLAELSSAGVRQMMDGHGGDYTLNPRGQAALARLLRKREWRAFAKEWRAHRRVTGHSLRTMIALEILPHVAPDLLPSTWRKRLKSKMPWRDQPVQRAFAERMIATAAVNLRNLRATPSDATAMRERLEGSVRRASRGTGGSTAASYHGLTLTRPFHDKRVVELALAIPEELYVRNGRNRYLARQALADIYPPEFQTRWRKNDDEIPDFQRMVERIKPRLLAEISRMEGTESLNRMIDFKKVRDLLDVWGPGEHNSGWEEESQVALDAFMTARYIEWFRRGNS